MSYHKPVLPRTSSVQDGSNGLIARHPGLEGAGALPPPERLLVKVAEAARLLSVSERTIRNLVSDGTLEARGSHRLRRITMASLRRYAEEEHSNS